MDQRRFWEPHKHRDLKGQQIIKVLTYRLFEGKYDPVSGFGELMDSVPDPLEARKSFLLENRCHKFVSAEIRQMNKSPSSFTDLKVEALDSSEGLQDLGRHGGGQHVDAVGVRWVRMALLPVEEHPPSQQGSQLVS